MVCDLIRRLQCFGKAYLSGLADAVKLLADEIRWDLSIVLFSLIGGFYLHRCPFPIDPFSGILFPFYLKMKYGTFFLWLFMGFISPVFAACKTVSNTLPATIDTMGIRESVWHGRITKHPFTPTLYPLRKHLQQITAIEETAFYQDCEQVKAAIINEKAKPWGRKERNGKGSQKPIHRSFATTGKWS